MKNKLSMEGDKKMKTKKSGAYAALAAVLLISAVLITNCVDPINPGGLFVPKGKDQPAAFVPPPGMGYVTLNFGAGRTIRPASGDFAADETEFIHFDVVFTPDASSATPGTTSNGGVIGVDYDELLEHTFVLGNGSYIVEVYAFDIAHDEPAQAEDPPIVDLDKAVAYGFATLSVVAGQGGPVSITLSSIITATRASTLGSFTGTGTFELNLTNAATPSPASTYVFPADKINMTITKYPTPVPAETPVVDNIPILDPDALDGDNLPDPIDDLKKYSTSLPPGYYRVALTLSGNARMEPKTITEILHVYHGMTSTYTATLPTLGRNVYDVLFTYGDARTTDGTSISGAAATETVSHGGTLDLPGAPYNKHVDTYTAGVPNYDETLEIEGWYTAAPTGSSPNLVFDPTKKWSFTSGFLRDAHLYAKWEKTGVYVTVNYTPPVQNNDPNLSIWDDTNSAAVVEGTSVISLTSKPTLIVSFTGTGYTNIVWKVDNVTQSSTTASLTIDLSDADNVNLLRAGDHVISVEATHSGQTVSASISFKTGE
jgi:hypothetical protein